MSGSRQKTVTMPRMRSKTSTKNSQQSPGHVLTTPGVSSPWLQNYDLSWNRSLLPWLNLSVTPCPQNCSWIGCHSGCIEDDASKGGGDVMTTHSFHLLFLILSLISLLFLSSFVSHSFYLLMWLPYLRIGSCGMTSQEHWFPSRVQGSIAFQDIPWASTSFHAMSFLCICLDTSL